MADTDDLEKDWSDISKADPKKAKVVAKEVRAAIPESARLVDVLTQMASAFGVAFGGDNTATTLHWNVQLTLQGPAWARNNKTFSGTGATLVASLRMVLKNLAAEAAPLRDSLIDRGNEQQGALQVLQRKIHNLTESLKEGGTLLKG